MANLNKVMLIGNLTRDPELRMSPRGTAVCTFSLAVNRKWRDEAGADREEVTYVDIEAWDKAGETVAKYCAKGRPLFVEGRLRLDQWEDKDTKEKRNRMKVVVEGFQFLGSPRTEQSPQSAQESRTTFVPGGAPRPAAATQDNNNGDVPF